MLRAVGLGDDDWDRSQIGVASSWNEVTPCNMPLQRLAKAAKEGVRAAGGFPLEFGTIAVSDGISMGHEGMRASLVSREVIADSVECVVHAERLDGTVLLAGCDKSLPGMLMAAARLDLGLGLPLRRVDPARPAARRPASSPCRTCSRRSAPGPRGRIDDAAARRGRAARLPERGLLRRHVHRQHDGVGGRGARHVDPRLGVRAGAGRAPGRVRAGQRRGRRPR